jgi:hypothetical protein
VQRFCPHCADNSFETKSLAIAKAGVAASPAIQEPGSIAAQFHIQLSKSLDASSRPAPFAIYRNWHSRRCFKLLFTCILTARFMELPKGNDMGAPGYRQGDAAGSQANADQAQISPLAFCDAGGYAKESQDDLKRGLAHRKMRKPPNG